MAGSPPKPDPRVIVAYLDDAEIELDAAQRLLDLVGTVASGPRASPMPGFGVAQDITIEELEAAMARAVDRDGNDLRLAETVERMTPEERRESDRNIRRWVERFRLAIRSDRGASDDV